MGHYTEFFFAAELKPETPEDVIEALYAMTEGYKLSHTPEHALFKAARWDHMLHGGSAYSIYDRPVMKKGRYSREWELHVHSNFKNYDDEIGLFLAWIAPYVAPHHPFLGYYRYENEVAPTLIYINKAGEIVTDPIAKPEGVNG